MRCSYFARARPPVGVTCKGNFQPMPRNSRVGAPGISTDSQDAFVKRGKAALAHAGHVEVMNAGAKPSHKYGGHGQRDNESGTRPGSARGHDNGAAWIAIGQVVVIGPWRLAHAREHPLQRE